MWSCCDSTSSFINLQTRALHELAKVCWGKFVLKEELFLCGKIISFPRSTQSLIIYRCKVLKNIVRILNDLSQPFSVHFPIQLLSRVTDSVFNLQQGYYEAIVWMNKYQFSLPLNIFYPVASSKYEAANFIEPTGHFNDLALVKQFVTDESKEVYYRFKMACFYCLEDILNSIWNSLKTEGRDPFLFISEQNESNYNLIHFWSYQLRSKTGESSVQRTFHADALYNCLIEAIISGHEYAARFFWSHCSDFKKQEVLVKFKLSFIISSAIKNRSGIEHFLYSLLSQEHKRTLVFRELIERGNMSTVWYCLLDSQFYNCVLNDILTYPESIPVSVYETILSLITCNIERFENPKQKNILKILWNHLSRTERNQVLEESSYIIITYVKLNEIDILETIIKPLSHYVKDEMLFHDWKRAGISAVNDISMSGDYDILLRYLLFFLIGDDSSTGKISVRICAKTILERLRKLVLNEVTIINASANQEICKIIDILQESLSTVKDILHIS